MLNQQESNLLHKILNYTCQHFQITPADLTGKGKKIELLNARATFAYVSNQYVKVKKDIANFLDKDHSCYYGWERRLDITDVKDGIRVVNAKLEDTLEIFKSINEYFTLKENRDILKKEIASKQFMLDQMSNKLDTLESEMKIMEIWK